MLGEYKVNRCTRRCHSLGRPLREGEWYYSVIMESGDDYERRDYSAESWSGPPEEAIGWWKAQMPTAEQKQMVLAPNEVLVDILRQMAALPAKAKSRYLLALMLLRRKVVRAYESTGESADESLPADVQVMNLEVVADGSTIEVEVCDITRGEANTLSDELNQLLYCEARE